MTTLIILGYVLGGLCIVVGGAFAALVAIMFVIGRMAEQSGELP